VAAVAVTDEVVVDSNRRNLVVTLVDENGAVIDLTGGSAKLQGQSDDLATPDIDYAGTLTSPAQGEVTFTQIGTLVTAVNLGSLKKATYNLRVRFTDASTKFDYSPKFQIDWVEKPV